VLMILGGLVAWRWGVAAERKLRRHGRGRTMRGNGG